MGYPNPCLEDMKAAREAFDKEDFAFLNIMGNRLTSNAVFLEHDKERFLMAGFFAKDLAIELLVISGTGKTAAISTAKTIASPYLNKVFSLVTEGTEFDAAGFWKLYEDYSEGLRKFSLTEVEDRVYTENRQFTRVAADWLLRYLQEQKDLLLDARNQLMEGMLNELGRIYRAHGAALRELQALALLDYLQKVYAYARYAFTKSDMSLEADIVRSEVHPLVDQVISLFLGSGDAPTPQDVDKVLLELLLKWRRYFLRYMELGPPPRVAPEKGIELPEETRKRITEAITKSLERETH